MSCQNAQIKMSDFIFCLFSFFDFLFFIFFFVSIYESMLFFRLFGDYSIFLSFMNHFNLNPFTLSPVFYLLYDVDVIHPPPPLLWFNSQPL